MFLTMIHYVAGDDMFHEFAAEAGKGYWSVICCITFTAIV